MTLHVIPTPEVATADDTLTEALGKYQDVFIIGYTHKEESVGISLELSGGVDLVQTYMHLDQIKSWIIED